jgi:hypothetical protein
MCCEGASWCSCPKCYLDHVAIVPRPPHHANTWRPGIFYGWIHTEALGAVCQLWSPLTSAFFFSDSCPHLLRATRVSSLTTATAACVQLRKLCLCQRADFPAYPGVAGRSRQCSQGEYLNPQPRTFHYLSLNSLLMLRPQCSWTFCKPLGSPHPGLPQEQFCPLWISEESSPVPRIGPGVGTLPGHCLSLLLLITCSQPKSLLCFPLKSKLLAVGEEVEVFLC